MEELAEGWVGVKESVGVGVRLGVEIGVSEGIAVGGGSGVHVGVDAGICPAQPAAENAKRISQVMIGKEHLRVLLIDSLVSHLPDMIGAHF